jgi:comEA protein
MTKTLKRIGMALALTSFIAGSAFCASQAPGTTHLTGTSGVQKASPKKSRDHKSHKKALPTSKVNVNRATVEQLQTLPRIGAKVAQRIVDYRKAHKGFRSIEELRNVKGIGAKTLEGLRPYVSL